MNQLLQTLRNLGPLRLAALAGTLITVIIFFGFLTTKMAAGPMGLLYNNLDPADGGSIVAQLEAQKIPYKISNNGTSIEVPTDMVGKLRMTMAEAGLPRGGSIGYEIFDQKDAFSTTSFVQNINQLRALEGELARTISTLTPIQNARVHLVLPKREMFSQTEQKATASVFLKMKAAGGIEKGQVSAIRQLIAAAVPGLKAENISIVDDQGNLLAKALDSSSKEAEASNQDEMRENYEKMQADKIEELLSRTLGYGKVRAQVSAEMDFDKVTTSSEIYDPESQVVRSTQSVSEDGTTKEGGTEAVSAANNLPGGAAAGGSSSTNKNSRSEETVNYEINKTVRNQIRESGSIRKQSVAVVVDGTYEPAAEAGKPPVYKPRSKEELDQIKALVRSAVNIDPTRGDTLEVANMPFASTAEEVKADNGIMSMLTPEIMRLIESVIMSIVGLLAILLVVRPILKQVLDGASAATGEAAALAAGGGQAALAGGGVAAGRLPPPGGALTGQIAAEAAQEAEALDQMIDLSRVEGRVKASSVKKVGEIVEKHPEEAVSILRNWIYADNK